MVTFRVDPNRVPSPAPVTTTTRGTPTTTTTPVTRSAAVTNHIGITVTARDATGKAVVVDVADLDDASIEAWLELIKDPLKRAKYRKLLVKVRTPTGT